MTTPDAEARARFRHDLANPLSAILAEAQLLLLEGDRLDPEVRRALQAIEEQALRMRALLRAP